MSDGPRALSSPFHSRKEAGALGGDVVAVPLWEPHLHPEPLLSLLCPQGACMHKGPQDSAVECTCVPEGKSWLRAGP